MQLRGMRALCILLLLWQGEAYEGLRFGRTRVGHPQRQPSQKRARWEDPPLVCSARRSAADSTSAPVSAPTPVSAPAPVPAPKRASTRSRAPAPAPVSGIQSEEQHANLAQGSSLPSLPVVGAVGTGGSAIGGIGNISDSFSSWLQRAPPWTTRESDLLVSARRNRKGWPEVSLLLSRSIGACKEKYYSIERQQTWPRAAQHRLLKLTADLREDWDAVSAAFYFKVYTVRT
ncbi:hypothetical protein B484DRAFT_461890 [Ochromonadaceae sp. CCMP2298]|nr:hypothetical protein B484DRAFT_461890 [Ochromonadaceae sp. CCMP2298]